MRVGLLPAIKPCFQIVVFASDESTMTVVPRFLSGHQGSQSLCEMVSEVPELVRRDPLRWRSD